MPVSAVVSLNAKAQGIAGKLAIVEGDLSGKCGVGMWAARKANAALIAQGDAKGGAVLQVPGDRVPVHVERASTAIFLDAVAVYAEIKGSAPLTAEFQAIEVKSLNKAQ